MKEFETTTHPDMAALFDVASGQMGYFTTSQARDYGFRGNLLTYHVKTGRFLRVYRGVYRFRDFPSSPREEVMAAWLAVGKDKAVVSHESALDLLELGDIIPSRTHFIVSRESRNLPTFPDVAVHTRSKPLAMTEVMRWEGLKLTSPARTIVDIAEAFYDPVQVQHAARDAIREGWTTPAELTQAARDRSQRVRELVSGVAAAFAK